MEQLGNILEALRFAGDQMKDQKLSTDMSALHHAIETANILWHIGKVQDQRILMAGALHQVPRIQEELKAGVEDIFGKEVSQYIQAARDPENLKTPYLERLKLKKNKKDQAGRQIYLAASAALLRHLRDNTDQLEEIRKTEEMQTRKSYIAEFSGSYPELENFFNQLMGEEPTS